MIGSLRGTVIERGTDAEVLLEVHGVGYRVTVTPRTLAALDAGAEAFLHVHHHIREDAQTLYGFLSRDERVCFEALLGAHRVGPALALAILATHGRPSCAASCSTATSAPSPSCPASASRPPPASCWS